MTTTAPAPAAEVAASRPAWWRRTRAFHLALALLGFLLLNVVAGTRGFVSADETVAHEQVELLAEGTWTAPVDDPILADDPRFHPLEAVSWTEDGYAPYAKHPLFPVLLLAGDALGGRLGRFLVVGVAAAVASAILAGVIERRQPGWWVRGFWLSMAGTTLPFHGAVLWAHALGAVAVAVVVAVVEAVVADRSIRPWSWLALIGAVLAAVWLRSEAAIFFVVLGAVSAGLGARRSRWALASAGLVIAGGAVVGFFSESAIRAAVLGPAAVGVLSAPGEALFDLELRWFLTQLWVTGFSGSVLTLFPFIGLVLLLVEARRAVASSVRVPVLIVAAACYAVGLTDGPTMSFVATMPLPLLGLVTTRRRDLFFDLVMVSTVLYFAAIVMTSYAAAGGGDWGGRYLFLAVGPIVVAAAPGLERLATIDRRVVAFGLAVSAMLLAGMTNDVVTSRRAAAALSDELAIDLDRAGSLAGQESIIAITDPRVSRLLTEDETPGRLLLVEDQSTLEALLRAMNERREPPCLRYVDALNPLVELPPETIRAGDVAVVAVIGDEFRLAEQAFCSARR